MIKQLVAASIFSIAAAGAAQASTFTQADALSGGALVQIYQSVNNTGNIDNSADATLAIAQSNPFVGSAIYTGDFWFETTDSTDGTTIDDWLTSAGGSYTELSGFDELLEISNPNIGGNSPVATTTWFVFSAVGASAIDLNVDHDDGLEIIDDNAGNIYLSPQPQTANGFSSTINWDGGFIQFAYAATNGDPSVLKIAGDGTIAPVPLPAGAPLLLAALGAFAYLRRKAKS